MTLACPDCGRTWDDGGLWCGACGAALPASAGPGRRRAGTGGPPTRHRSRPLVGLLVATAAVLVAAGVVVTLGGGGDGAPPTVAEDAVAEGQVDVPTRAPAPGDVEDAGIPMELLATCDGPDGPEGCVRWVQRAGQPARPGTQTLATVVADRVVALDPATGQRTWAAAATPPVAPPAGVGDHTLLVEDAVGVRALDADDGDERWRVPGQFLPLTSPEAHEQPVVVLDDQAGTVSGVALADGEVRWTRALGGTQGWRVTTVPVAPDGVLVATGDAIWMLDVDTGRVRWAAGEHEGATEVAVAVTDQHVVTLVPPDDDAGVPTARVRTTSGRLLTDAPMPAERVHELAITDGHLVLRTSAELLGLDLDSGEVAWRRADVRGSLVGSRAAPLGQPGWMGGHVGFATIATRSWSVVVLGTDGTVTVLDPRTGQDARTYGEPSDGIRISDGFLTQRHLWRVDADSLEVVDIPSLTRVLRIEVRAPPTVVWTDPVVIATSGRLVRLDTSSPTGDGTRDE